jgi:hypothetical protein
MKELAGGADDWQTAGDPALRITWDQVCCFDMIKYFKLLGKKHLKRHCDSNMLPWGRFGSMPQMSLWWHRAGLMCCAQRARHVSWRAFQAGGRFQPSGMAECMRALTSCSVDRVRGASASMPCVISGFRVSGEGAGAVTSVLLSSRLVDGVELLARLLHPEAVSKTLADGLVQKLDLANGQRCRQRALPSHFHNYT